MITHIKVRNFLSLKDVDLDLRARNVFVGANMSGKSNLIECFKFLHEALSLPARPDESPLHLGFHKRGTFDQVVWKGRPGGPIEFKLGADLLDPNSSRAKRVQYQYFVSVKPHEYGYPEVCEERLEVQRGGKWTTILENAANDLIVETAGKSTRRGSNHPMELAVESMGREKSSSCYEFRKLVGDWQFYSLIPALMRQGNKPAKEHRLCEHGENLSSWLMTLQAFPEFQTIKQVCRDVLPGISEIFVQAAEEPKLTPTGGNLSGAVDASSISIGTSEAGFDRPTGIARMSDGELAFLALTSLILAPEELTPPLICIEEPENYLHPRLLEILIELLNQRQMKTPMPQIIMTTHSPLLVDKLTLDDLVVTEKFQGATIFTRASTKKHLKQLLARKEVGLGDLWFSGALSGS